MLEPYNNSLEYIASHALNSWIEVTREETNDILGNHVQVLVCVSNAEIFEEEPCFLDYTLILAHC